MKTPNWRIAEHIAREASIAGGYARLADQINKLTDGKVVDRRKLTAIAKNKPLTISTKELIAIDNYFSPMGEGFGDQPLFERRSLLEDLAENEDLSILIGAFQRTKEESNDVSLWDMTAYQEILKGTQRYRAAIQSTLIDVPFFDDANSHNRNTKQLADLLPRPNHSICVIGSTRANVVAELALANLFSIEPFDTRKRRLPFKFIWPKDERITSPALHSAFQAKPEDIKKLDPDLAAELGGDTSVYALQVGKEIYRVSPRDAESGSDYGIVAARRHTNGRILMIAAGATGPSTKAAAIAARTLINVALPSPPRNRKPRTALAVVKATFSQGKRGTGDRRIVENVSLVGEIQFWPK